MSERLSFELPDSVIESIVERAAAAVIERLGVPAPVSPYLTVAEAAEYVRCSRQRIYDLRSSGQLSRLGDGSRALVSRAELDEIVAGGVAHVLPTAARNGSGSGARR